MKYILTLLYASCSALCAPSDAAPIALASNFVRVPEGSVWYLSKLTFYFYIKIMIHVQTIHTAGVLFLNHIQQPIEQHQMVGS